MAMAAANPVVEATCGGALLVSVVALCCGAAISNRPSSWPGEHASSSGSGPSAPLPVAFAPSTSVSGIAPTACADQGWQRATHPDGGGGWYAVVEVVGRSTGVPRGGIDEDYSLLVVGTSRVVELLVMDELLNWWPRDRFVAHLRPGDRSGHAPEP